MNKGYLLMLAGAVLSGGAQAGAPERAVRVPALPVRAWDASEWISARGAPVADEATRRRQRAADGTSCFWRRVVNRKDVKAARWMTTGLGVYELYLNGRPVGADDALKPGFTHWKKTKIAFTYDVTPLLRRGAGERNDFAAEVSAGWWRDQIVRYRGEKSAFRGVVELTYDDGTTELVGTRASEWFGAVAGPVKHAAIFDGEEYDARETNAARKPGEVFAAGGCERNEEFKGEIVPTAGAEVCRREDLAIRRGPYVVKPGETLVVDFGQNCAGVPSFVFSAARGTVLTALAGEMLNDADAGQRGCDGPRGSLYRENLRIPGDGMRVVYTFAGDPVETYLPRFTFFGYRYVSVTATDEVTIKEVASLPVTSISREMEIGSVETGVPEVNRLISNVYWGQLSNYLSVPTDCPQRNERLGWMADTQVFCEAGGFNADTRAFFRKWLRDVRDTQAPNGGYPGVAPDAQYGSGPSDMMRIGWADAGVIVPYQVWKQFGDRAILAESWDSMERFMARVDETGYEQAAIRRDCGNYQWADWLSYEKLESCSGRAFETVDGAWRPRKDALAYWDYLGGCYWMWDAQMMARMARALGKDEAKYARMAERAKARLVKRFFAAEDGMILPVFRDMQTPALFALKLGLVEGEARAKTLAALRQNIADHGGCLQTGFLGTSVLMDTLTECGCADIAYGLLLQRRNPSWLYSVDQGATTIWERWNSYTKKDGFGPVAMNSFNHYAYGSVLAWIYKTAAGIAPDPDSPGFRNIVMRPVPDRRLGRLTASYKSAAGLVRSAWRYEGAKWIWDFTVPEGATAAVTLPGEDVATTYGPGAHRVERAL